MRNAPLHKKKLVSIYAPDGTERQETRQNARDLVVNAGYSWDPLKPAHPLDPPPFRTTKAPKSSQAQEVLNSVGGTLDKMDDKVGEELVETNEDGEELVDYGNVNALPSGAQDGADIPALKGRRRGRTQREGTAFSRLGPLGSSE